MKQIIVVAIVLITTISSFSQKGLLKYDSLFILKEGGYAELILKSRTKDTSGFLFNKGNGVTEFRRVLKKLNDTTYLIGLDTLRFNSSTSGSSGGFLPIPQIALDTAGFDFVVKDRVSDTLRTISISVVLAGYLKSLDTVTRLATKYDLTLINGGSNPGGSNKQVQFNNGGVLSGSSNLTQETNQILVSQTSTSVVPFGIKALPSPTSNLFNISSASGTGDIANFDKDGLLTVPSGSSSKNAITFGSSTGLYKGGSGALLWSTAGGMGYGALGNGYLEFYPTGSNGIFRGGGNVGTSVTASFYLGVNNTSWLYQFGETGGTANNQTLRVHGTTGTNATGASFIFQSGFGTGAGSGGDFKIQTGIPATSGTAQHSPGDRFVIVGKYTSLTESSNTPFIRINIPFGTSASGRILLSVEASDGTDIQNRVLEFRYTAVNKGGTVTYTISAVPEEEISVSSGTLTVSINGNDAGSGNLDLRVNAVSSLNQTLLRASCQVLKNFGTGSIQAQ